jgi:formylglycine-generating enzyme required for sulfatase activity
MRMVQGRLDARDAEALSLRTVWFNAWLYSRERAVWRSLIARVVQSVRQFALTGDHRAALDRLEARLYQPARGGDERIVLPPGCVPGLAGVGTVTPAGLELLRRRAQRAGEEAEVEALTELLRDARVSRALNWREALVALDDFRRQFEDLSTGLLNHGRVVVFIDDLDRCLPDKAVEVLEAVKLFLDVPGFVFVLGVDRAVIAEGIRVRYRDYETELDGARYLEKIIQIPFKLPPIDAATVTRYVHDETAGRLPDPRCETVFSAGLEPNPRRIKRTLNVFLLLWRLAQNREELRDVINPVRLAKIVVIQQYHPALFDLLVQGPHYLPDLESRLRARAEVREEGALEGRDLGGRGTGTGGGEAISAGPLQPFLGDGLLRALLTCTAEGEPDANFAGPQGLTPDGVRTYIYLTRSAVEEEPADREVERLPFEPQLVRVDSGPFLMGSPESEVDELFRLAKEENKNAERGWVEREVPQHEVNLDYDYAIGRYPVTNAEFERFIDDGGYEDPDYWTEAGWQRKEKEDWSQPRFWDNETWNGPSQPVVGVSWYEAAAYCRWLSAKSGRTYRLPSEAEWEKAARGTDGRRYPWGDAWDPALCNNKARGPGRTTPVGEYPEGESPYGVEDLVGQVWEWCRTKYDSSYPYLADDGREDEEGSDMRIVRGGSWASGSGWCRCGCRYRNYPRFWHNDGGFRCVRTLS